MRVAMIDFIVGLTNHTVGEKGIVLLQGIEPGLYSLS